MFGFHLIWNWRAALQMYSVQLLILGAAFSGVASVLSVFGYLPWVQQHPFAFLGIAAVVNVLALAGRLVDQPKVHE
jgi:hypothetical protein